ncbi:MAG: AhpC/TSA family protein [Muribaculaceae bacterium]|nr:AhpC/TSA family protein [Muribaculaceae bacterium]
MKKLLYFLAVGLITLAACNQNSNYKVVVTFPDNSADGDTAYLTSYDSGDTLLTGVVKDKFVVLEGEVDGSFMSRLLVAGKRIGFVVEKGEISIMMQDGKATGTALNDRMNVLDEELSKLEDDSLMTDLFYKAYKYNKENAIGPWAFNYYLMYNSFTPTQIDSLLKDAPEGYRNLKRVQKAIKASEQLVATAVGKKFTDFSAPNGTALSKYAGNGKYTLVDFWASWCGPCRREIPNIKKLYEKFSSKMNFVGVAVWDNPDDTHKAVDELGIVWPVMEGGKNWTEPTDLYGVSGIPHIMLIDPEGVIVARGLEGETMIKTIEDLKL